MSSALTTWLARAARMPPRRVATRLREEVSREANRFTLARAARSRGVRSLRRILPVLLVERFGRPPRCETDQASRVPGRGMPSSLDGDAAGQAVHRGGGDRRRPGVPRRGRGPGVATRERHRGGAQARARRCRVVGLDRRHDSAARSRRCSAIQANEATAPKRLKRGDRGRGRLPHVPLRSSPARSLLGAKPRQPGARSSLAGRVVPLWADTVEEQR
jgi:hypothetical protein